MKLYYYLNSRNEQQGPVVLEQLLFHGVTRDTMVWTEGMPQWQRAGEVADLLQLFAPQGSSVPPPPFMNTGEAVPPPVGNFQYRYEQEPSPRRSKPDSYLVFSILVTVLCCVPLGIVALIYACQVDGHWSRGAYDEAESASKRAKAFCLISLGIGILSYIVSFGFALIGVL